MVYGSEEQTIWSGIWKITPNFISSSDFCSTVVDICYALQNAEHDGIEKMVGLAQLTTASNPDGAIEWYLDNGIATDPILIANGITFNDVEMVAKAAFCDWENASGIEFRYMGGTNNANNLNDKKNTIYFGNPPGGLGGHTTKVLTNGLCNNDPIFRDRLVEFEINMDKQVNWFVSMGSNIGNNQFDFYTILLHEIGHGILLKHAMDTDPDNLTFDDRIMYFKRKNGQIQRIIDGKTASGIQFLKNQTIENIDDPSGCFNGYDLNIYPDGCMTPVNAP